MFRSELVAVDRLSGERQAHDGEVKRLGDNPVVVEFTADGAKIEVAAKTEHRALVTGPLVPPPAPARSHT
jgi:hypothetical protein